MSGPPPPHRRRKLQADLSSAAGAGINAVRSHQPTSHNLVVPSLSLPPNRNEEGGDGDGDLYGGGSGSGESHIQEEGYDALLDELPETAIGDGVDIRGELQFDRLLRVDGTFEGKLRSSGSIVVGRKGCLIADVNGMETLIIDGGKLIGNVQVDRLILRGSAFLEGNFSCKSLAVGAHCTILGRSNVHSLSPEIIDVHGTIIVLEPGTSVDKYYAAKAAQASATAALSANTPKHVWAARPQEKTATFEIGPEDEPSPGPADEATPGPATPSAQSDAVLNPTVVFSSGLGSPRVEEKEVTGGEDPIEKIESVGILSNGVV